MPAPLSPHISPEAAPPDAPDASSSSSGNSNAAPAPLPKVLFFNPPPCPSLGDLPRPGARLCLQVARFVKQECSLSLQGAKIVLAVSGGADSLALLTIFTALRAHTGHTLAVAHIDHGLRPESRPEGQSVAALCAAWGINCYLYTAPVAQYAAAHSMGTEEAGRHLRYALLEECRSRHAARWIATGHHREDLAEDMLLRFVRGTGWPALGGMAAVDPQRQLVRPLLHCDPAALRELLQGYGLEWHEDASNADTSYTRNRLRHTIMPLLQAENPALHQGVQNLWTLAQEDAKHWHAITTAALAAHHVALSPPRIILPKALLQAVDKATRLRLYMRAIQALQQGQARASTLMQLDAAWQQGRGNTHFQLPGKVSARLRQGIISFDSM